MQAFPILLAVLNPGEAAAVPAAMSVSAAKLTFVYNNGTQPGPQQLNLLLGSATASWTASTDKPWLTVSPATGAGSAKLQVSIKSVGLAPSSYMGHVTIAAPGASPSSLVVNVTFTVFSANLAFDVKEVTVTVPANGQAKATFNISNTGGYPLTWTAASQNSWLTSFPVSGGAPARLQLSANLSGYPPGRYRGNVTVTAPGANGSPAILAFNAIVGSPPSAGPQLLINPSKLNFGMTVGGSAPGAQAIAISDSPATTASFSAHPTAGWIVLSQPGGSIPSQLMVSVNTAGLTPGDYQGAVQITAAALGGSPVSIPVELKINSAATPTLHVGPSTLTFSMTQGGAAPGGQMIAINDSPATALPWSAQANQNWILLSSNKGTVPAQLQVSVNAAGLNPGTYQGMVQVTATGLSGSPASVPLSLTIGPSSPPPSGGAGAQYYVSPTGSHLGNGSIADPWDLNTALSHPAAVKPGSTIWLRGGTYYGTYTSSLAGTPAQPIIVRQYPGERATIDTGSSGAIAAIVANGSDTWFWGFEIMSSNPNRRFGQPGSNNPPDRANGIGEFGPRNKFINLVIHDMSQGIGTWVVAVGSEIYGCLIYYNGWDAPDRGHGHGIYVQNQTGVKLIQDNIAFDGFGMNYHAYGADAHVDNIHLIGNVGFDGGYLDGGPSNHWSNYLVTAGIGASGILFDSNHSFHHLNDGSGRSQLGWEFSGVEHDLVATNNYFVGGLAANEVWNWNQLTFTGNTIYNPLKTTFMTIFNTRVGTPSYTYDHNTYYGQPLFRYQGTNVNSWPLWQNTTHVDANSQYSSKAPTGAWTFVRPNKYESSRANIIIYNWDLSSYVSVDVSSVLKVGQQYVVQDAMNFYGPPVASGVYNGSPIAIRMTGLTLAPPVGNNIPFQPVHTAPVFGTFVVLGR